MSAPAPTTTALAPGAPISLDGAEHPHPPREEVAESLAAACADALRAGARATPALRDALRSDLADYLNKRYGTGLRTAHIWPGNGCQDLTAQILRCYAGPGGVALEFTPTRSGFRAVCEASDTRWTAGPRDDALGIDALRALDTIARTHPDVVLFNSPTGLPPRLDLIEAAAESCGAMLLVDESAAEYHRPGTASAASLIANHPQVIVLRSLAPAFGLDAVDLAYLAAAPAAAENLRLQGLPTLSAVTQCLGRAALAHADRLLRHLDTARTQRELIALEAEGLGLRALPGEEDFVVLAGLHDAPATRRRLAEHGVMVADGPIPGSVRVTAGTPTQTTAFLNALQRCTKPERNSRPCP